MDNREKHQSCLGDTKRKEERNSGRHSERGKKGNNKNHGMKKMEVLLKAFVLECASEGWS